MPITIAPTATPLVVSAVKGQPDFRRRLGELGIVAGANIKIVGESAAGVIFEVAGAQLAMDKKSAAKVRVEVAG